MKLLIFLFLMLLITSVQAATFDCAKARSEVEKMICTEVELSKLDDSLNTQYQQALQRDDIKKNVIASQRAWLKNSRNICKTNECVKNAYETRLKELGLTSSFGIVFTSAPPGSKPPIPKSPVAVVEPTAVAALDTKAPSNIPIASPDEYTSQDSRCPDNLGAVRKYDIYHGSWATYVQDRALGFGLSNKAITILDTTSEMELAKLCDGKVVAAWVGYLPGMQMQDFVSVRIYDSQFKPLTEEFTVDESNRFQSDQSVAPLKNGGFVVTWRTPAPNAVQEYATHLHARVFGSDGKPISNVIDISSDNQLKVDANAYGLPNGGFVVAWKEGLYSIYLKYFDANGKNVSDVIRLLSSSDLATVHDAADYGYVSRNGGFNLFVTKSVGDSIFVRAINVNASGVPQTEILNEEDFKKLPGYRLMIEKYSHKNAFKIGEVLPGFNSHDKSGKPHCNNSRIYKKMMWKLSLYTEDADVLKLIDQVDDALSKCP